jgi:hypothetical protein
MARPKKQIDEKLLANLSQIHCTLEEMSSILGVSIDTLERRYAALIKENRDKGKMSLRRKLYEMALQKNNLGAIIWLSKQHLGMSEKVINEDGDVTKDASSQTFETKWGSSKEDA